MKINTAAPGPENVTHEGARAARIDSLLELRRAVMACLLWEDTFYESGATIASRIKALVLKVPPADVAALALEARGAMNLRHVPLLLCRELARYRTAPNEKANRLKAEWLAAVIQRPDELAEFLALLWKNGKVPIPAQAKRGLALAFQKFSEYSLAKYNRPDAAIKLRDVLFLSHAKPKDEEQAALWKRLASGQLATPDTWEVALSRSGEVPGLTDNEKAAAKRAAWFRLIVEKKLGALALLRNLRNMLAAGVDEDAILLALAEADVSRVLPFRFIAAARHAPRLEPALEAAMFRSLKDAPRLAGATAILVDVSGSMAGALSGKSEMTRIDAACALAMIAREVCESVRVFTFSDSLVEVPARRGFALRDAIVQSQPHSGTYLAQALARLNVAMNGSADLAKASGYLRLIVVTDEQTADTLGDLEGSAPRAVRSYMLNVGSYRNGVGYGRRWVHIDGFSEACVRYMVENERETAPLAVEAASE